MRITVVGAGFVGSNLVHMILEQKPRRVTVVDNFLSADPVASQSPSPLTATIGFPKIST